MGSRRENTGRGLTRLLATQPVSEGLHKTEDPVVRHVLHRDNRCLLGAVASLATSDKFQQLGVAGITGYSGQV
jgi:hypothetical protein